jgi:hypothetical protein
MKKIGPCRIIRKFGTNDYEIEISSIFNISYLYPYKYEEVEVDSEQPEVQWAKQMPFVEKPQMESILDKRVSKRTRWKEYLEYLVKWKEHPVEYTNWENEAEIQKHGQTMWELMDRSPWKFSSKGVWCRSIANNKQAHRWKGNWDKRQRISAHCKSFLRCFEINVQMLM